MLRVMNDPSVDPARRDRMATAAAPFVHAKVGEGGKKDQQADAAQKAAVGRFAPPPAPSKALN
jgi:phage terminase small subunit